MIHLGLLIFLSIMVLAFYDVASAAAPGSGSRKDTGRVAGTPDLMQSSAAASLPYKGAPYCGPVAASNGVVWLARTGYPGLVTEIAGSSLLHRQSDCDQGRLALKMGKFMALTRSMGTSVSGFVTGLDGYIRSCGYEIEELGYQGWESCPARFRKGERRPDPSSIGKYLDDRSQVWIKIGWYRYFKARDTYTRFAGHWVTVVGLTPAGILIHDPAPRSGPLPKTEAVSLSRISTGTLKTGWIKPFPARGMYRLGGQLKIKKRASCGILDGIVTLRVAPQTP